MKKAIQITIPEPCHEDWNKMTPKDQGRHCINCDKVVIDFTHTSDEELFKRVKNGASLCGRFKSTQLNRPITLSRKRNNSMANYAASLLIPAAIISTQEIKAQGVSPETSVVQKKYSSLGIGSHHQVLKKRFDPFAFDTVGIVFANGIPVAGATVTIKNSKRSSLTTATGNFVIEALPREILQVRLDGFETQEIAIDENAPKYKIHMGLGTLQRQGFSISGTVTDEAGLFPGVNVIIKGTTRGTQTDFDGNYSIVVQRGETLQFSYVGHDTIEIVITDQLEVSPVFEAIQASMILGGVAGGYVVIVEPAPKDTSFFKTKFQTASSDQKKAIKERRIHQEKVNLWKRFKKRLKKGALKKKD